VPLNAQELGDNSQHKLPKFGAMAYYNVLFDDYFLAVSA
jgi:hypothetical protein